MPWRACTSPTARNSSVGMAQATRACPGADCDRHISIRLRYFHRAASIPAARGSPARRPRTTAPTRERAHIDPTVASTTQDAPRHSTAREVDQHTEGSPPVIGIAADDCVFVGGGSVSLDPRPTRIISTRLGDRWTTISSRHNGDRSPPRGWSARGARGPARKPVTGVHPIDERALQLTHGHPPDEAPGCHRSVTNSSPTALRPGNRCPAVLANPGLCEI